MTIRAVVTRRVMGTVATGRVCLSGLWLQTLDRWRASAAVLWNLSLFIRGYTSPGLLLAGAEHSINTKAFTFLEGTLAQGCTSGLTLQSNTLPSVLPSFLPLPFTWVQTCIKVTLAQPPLHFLLQAFPPNEFCAH
jgi:hypothetical protein